ncbi:MAG: type IX secretion system membrane protein PorP/SprF [Bacteroidia bacterium]
MKKILLSFFCLLFGYAAFAQQDPQYSEYMFDQLAINPAYAGSCDVLSASLLARNQWVDIPGAPKTGNLILQGPLAGKNVGLGLEISSDKIGPTTNNAISGSYAYHLKLGQGKLALGIRAGIYDYQINWNEIDYKDKNDVYNSYSQTQKVIPTADAGLYYYTQTFYAGLSITHLLGSRMTDYNNPISMDASFKPHAYLNFGKGFQLSQNVILNPSILIKMAQNSPGTFDLNLNVLLDNKLWLGVSARDNYGLVLLAAFNITPQFRLGYSYDAGFNAIGMAGGAAHEMLLNYDFNTHHSKSVSPRFF